MAMNDKQWVFDRVDSAGVVKVGGIPRLLFTYTLGSPERLFYPLLLHARAAMRVALSCLACALEEERERGALYAENYMLGHLLRNNDFVLTRLPSINAHSYHLNFAEGTIQFRSKMYAAVEQAAGLFTIVMDGYIQGNKFSIKNPIDGRELAQVTEKDIQSPTFFIEEMPELVFAAHNRWMSTRSAKLNQQQEEEKEPFEFPLVFPLVSGHKHLIVLREEGTGTDARILEKETGRALGVLSEAGLQDIGEMFETVRQLVSPAPKQDRPEIETSPADTQSESKPNSEPPLKHAHASQTTDTVATVTMTPA